MSKGLSEADDRRLQACVNRVVREHSHEFVRLDDGNTMWVIDAELVRGEAITEVEYEDEWLQRVMIGFGEERFNAVRLVQEDGSAAYVLAIRQEDDRFGGGKTLGRDGVT